MADRIELGLGSSILNESITPAMKTFLTVILALGLTLEVQGEVLRRRSYQQMSDKADLVVIAKPLESKDTSERLLIRGYINAVGVETDLEIRAVFKGDSKLRKVVLHYYRLPSDHPTMIGGPSFVYFEDKKPDLFLLFLERNADGRYSPVFGQETAMGSAVVQLLGYAE